MPGRIVTATNLDSVRIEVLGEQRALTVPLALVLALDRVLRHCLAEAEGLAVEPVSEGPGKWEGWEAAAGNLVAHGDTPWGALVALGDAVQDGK